MFFGERLRKKAKFFFKSFCKNVLPSHRQKKKNVFLEPLQFFTTERITILVILSNRRNMEQVSKNQTNNSQENHSHGKVPFISKLAYGMGDVGWNQRSDYRHTHRQDTHQMGTIPSLAALWSTNHGIGTDTHLLGT